MYIYFIVWFSQYFTFCLSIIIAFFILLTETVVEVSRKLWKKIREEKYAKFFVANFATKI